MLADKGYDTNAIRRKFEGKSTMPCILLKANRLEELLLAILYRDRNAIERMFERVKDLRPHRSHASPGAC